MTIKHRWYFFVAVGALIGILIWRFRPATAVKDKAFTVKRANLVQTLSLYGEVDSWEKADLKFQTSGYLAWVGVKEGDRVTKYQTIANLDQREVEADLRKYLNTYAKYRWDFDQTKDNQAGQIVSDSLKRTLEKAQFDLNNAVIDVELKDMAKKFSLLWTPIDGIVTRVDTPNAGVNITTAGAVFTVVNPDTLYFLATADQSEVSQLAASISGTISLDAFSDSKIPATISAISFTPKSGETGTVYEVRLNFPPVNDPLRLGMTGDVEFVTKEISDVLFVPSKYLKTENGKKYVLGKNKEKIYVMTGEDMDGNVEIISGLKENDTIY